MNGARRNFDHWRRGAALAGATSVALALVLGYAEPGALGGWLAAFFFWSSLPIGALCLAAMMGLIPGAWRAELQAQAGAAFLLLPLAALSVIPVLVGLAGLYSWAGAPGSEGFRGIYLSPLFFIGRTVIFFAATGAIALLLLLRPQSTAIAAVGLIVFVLFDTTIAVDWLMSLEPDFHSSGFGLYVLSIQATIALAFLILSSLFAGNPGARTGVLGGCCSRPCCSGPISLSCSMSSAGRMIFRPASPGISSADEASGRSSSMRSPYSHWRLFCCSSFRPSVAAALG